MIVCTSTDDEGVPFSEEETFADMAALENDLASTATDEYTAKVLRGLREYGSITVANRGLLWDTYRIVTESE